MTASPAPRLSRLAALVELLTLPLVMLLIWRPSPQTTLALLGLPLLWTLRRVATGHFWRRTPLDWPLLVLLLMAGVSLWITALPEVTGEAVCYLVAGVAVLGAVVHWAITPRRLAWATAAFLLVGVALAAFAPFLVAWSGPKLFRAASLYARFQRVLPETVNPNILAGALVLMAPAALGLAIAGPLPNLPRARGWALRLGAGLIFLVIMAILILSQARGGLLAAAAGCGLALLLRSRWSLALLPLSALGVGLLSGRVGWSRLVEVALSGGAASSLEGRLEIWSRALYMLQDFAFTGIGMGNFNQVANILYPFFLVGPDAPVPHAHNLFLQVGVDLGFPALIAYLALLGLCFWMAWDVYRRGPGPARSLAAGLLGSQMALVVHGLVDAASWGVKPAVLAWALFGLTTSLWRLTVVEQDAAH